MLALESDFHLRLEMLKQDLAADFAIISQIKGHQYKVLDVASDFGEIENGAEFDTRDTYCSEVISSGEVVYIPHVGSIREMRGHPIYRAMGLEAYLGIPLRHDDEVVGTLNFSCFIPNDPNYTRQLIARAERLATDIEVSLVAETTLNTH